MSHPLSQKTVDVEVSWCFQPFLVVAGYQTKSGFFILPPDNHLVREGSSSDFYFRTSPHSYSIRSKPCVANICTLPMILKGHPLTPSCCFNAHTEWLDLYWPIFLDMPCHGHLMTLRFLRHSESLKGFFPFFPFFFYPECGIGKFGKRLCLGV